MEWVREKQKKINNTEETQRKNLNRSWGNRMLALKREGEIYEVWTKEWRKQMKGGEICSRCSCFVGYKWQKVGILALNKEN
jgi:hypothetical protein